MTDTSGELFYLAMQELSRLYRYRQLFPTKPEDHAFVMEVFDRLGISWTGN